jgi:(p)ppGpp synthase/HD superfamily hydrolase
MPTIYQPAPLPAELALIVAALTPDDSSRLLDIFQFAAAAHAQQRRDEGTPFIEHPVRVASILWTELGRREVDLVVAALAHDILEDCLDLSTEIVRDVIGAHAFGLVQDVTKPPAAPPDKDARDRAYLDRLPRLSVEARILKLADRIDNLRSVVRSSDREKAKRYLAVSRAEFLPLAAATDITAERLLSAACDSLEVHLER